jgi:RNA-directed DNA polymerase
MLERAKAVTTSGDYSAVEYARFADDLVVLVDAHPRHAWLKEAIPKRLRQELATLQVEVNEEKSTTVDLTRDGSFGFLGFDFRRVRSLRGAWRPQLHAQAQEAYGVAGEVAGGLPTLPLTTGGSGDRTDQSDLAGLGELLCGRQLQPVLRLHPTTGWTRRSGATLMRARKRRGFGWARWSRQLAIRHSGAVQQLPGAAVRRKRRQHDRSHNPRHEARR